MKYLVRVVTEETFQGLVTGYIGPFDNHAEASLHALNIEAQTQGELVEVYVERLYPPCS